MRRHLTEQDAAHHRLAKLRLHARSRTTDAGPTERLRLHREIVKAEKDTTTAPQTGKCSDCKRKIAPGKHIAVEVFCVMAQRGKAKRVDQPPLVKDYRPATRPYLYLCHKCGVRLGVVTQEELETGYRHDDPDA